jgi:hypothetical protein
MNTRNVLRYKIITSYVIAALGSMMFARVALIQPLTAATGMALGISAIFVLAGIWRARIYSHALKEQPGS